MAYTQAQNKATQKYSEKAYDQIKIVVPKGTRDKYKQQAESRGMSLNSYIISLLEKDRTED